MSENTKAFIDNLEAGNNADAGEAFKSALRDKMGNALDIKRKEYASSLFNKETPEAMPHSDPKPEIADPGTFDRDGNVLDTTGQKDGKAELELSQNGTADTMVGVDVNAGEPNS